ncbi:MAG: aminotransferase class I/II-fold pyridoxal phosphate-dependent enzyme [Bacillota bacterium]|nr:aminotransferase class I/II-fold pyridoxal phosphate-dependent enzyme [Bacillota bacterium]
MFKGTDIKPFEKKIWLASPTMHGEEQKYVQEAFDTNWVSTVGENLNQLEAGICEYTGSEYGVALSSGTAALHLAIKLAGIEQGDVVLCSDMTFVATVNPIIYEKGIPVFVDEEYCTWNMDPNALEQALLKYPEAKAVILVHLYGTPAKVDEIRSLCNRYGVILIEDAAESLGAMYRGQQTGTFGKYNAISFNGNKIITTSGGGMFLTNDKLAEKQVRKWSTQAREPLPWYQHEQTGYNYRMSNIVAGIGRGQLIHLDEHIALKKKIYMRYKEGLKDLPLTMNPYMPDAEPNFWLSCILLDDDAGITPDIIRIKLEEYNAEARPIWKPMHMQPIFNGCDFIVSKNGMNVGRDIFNRGLCLPSDITMTEEEQNVIIELIKSCFMGIPGRTNER